MGRSRPGGRLWLWALGALCLAALLWTGYHLRWRHEIQGAELTAPVAAAREGEAMASPWEGLLAAGKDPVPVNRAGEQELCRLAGVGPATAKAIMAQRQAWGPFSFPEDLLNVKGITWEKLEGMISDITLEK